MSILRIWLFVLNVMRYEFLCVLLLYATKVPELVLVLKIAGSGWKSNARKGLKNGRELLSLFSYSSSTDFDSVTPALHFGRSDYRYCYGAYRA